MINNTVTMKTRETYLNYDLKKRYFTESTEQIGDSFFRTFYQIRIIIFDRFTFLHSYQ